MRFIFQSQVVYSRGGLMSGGVHTRWCLVSEPQDNSCHVNVCCTLVSWGATGIFLHSDWECCVSRCHCYLLLLEIVWVKSRGNECTASLELSAVKVSAGNRSPLYVCASKPLPSPTSPTCRSPPHLRLPPSFAHPRPVCWASVVGIRRRFITFMFFPLASGIQRRKNLTGGMYV